MTALHQPMIILFMILLRNRIWQNAK